MKLRLAFLLALVTLLASAVVAPLLYGALGGIVSQSHEQLFVEDSRTVARLLAQQLEVGNAVDSPKLVANVLDTAILNADGDFAEFRGPGLAVRSELAGQDVRFPDHEDLGFGQGNDTTYFIKTPVHHAGAEYELRLGFDERPTLAIVALARRNILWSLAGYLGLLTLAGLVLGHLVTRPLRQLQSLAREVVDHPGTPSLLLATPVAEVSGLAADLQRMREALVAASERLQAQAIAREAAEVERAALERRLQHRERLETVGTLAGGIAHEINNALVPITLLTDLALRDARLAPPLRADLGTVLEAARQARALLRQILTFSRTLDPAQLQPIELAPAVEDSLRLFRPLAGNQVEVRFEAEPGCPPVRADRGLVAQLVQNLCTNALQALGPAGGRIGVRVRPAGGAAQLEVEDDGRGMDEATLAHVFEPFYTTRAPGEGTGLGLSVVHGIVRGLGGTIEVESRPGVGTSFRIRFPVSEPTQEVAT